MNLYIGTIIFGEATAKYLPDFFASLKIQTNLEYKLLLWDNSPELENASTKLALEHFGFEALRGKAENIGFARAYNQMITEASEAGARYFLALNPDMLLVPEAVRLLLTAIDADEGVASVAPKVRRWDFDGKKKTELIDTCGLFERAPLRFIDLGQGTADHGQYDDAVILGPSGAAALYRISALESVRDENGYFDERMFMYKEDCDLAYRLSVAGFKSQLVPQALVYHDRTAVAQGESLSQILANRQNKSRQVRIWSFVNQHLLILKHWHKQSWQRKISLVFFLVQNLGYVLVMERYLLREYRTIWKMK